VVSTDPASNLDDVFVTTVGPEAAPVPGDPLATSERDEARW